MDQRMKFLCFSALLFFSVQLAAQQESLRPLQQFVGYYNVGTKPNKPFFKSRWYLKEGKLYTIYDSDVDRPFEPYADERLNTNVYYKEEDLPPIEEGDSTYYVILQFGNNQLDQFKIIRPRGQWNTDLYGYRIKELDARAVDAEATMDKQLKTNHFNFVYSQQDDSLVARFSKKIESGYEQLLLDFGIASLPTTTIKIFPDLRTYHNGVLTPWAPDWQKGRVWTKNEIRLVSPVYLREKKGEDAPDDLITHEFVHILHWNKAGDPNQVVKWLWEGVALYKGCCAWGVQDLTYLSDKKGPSIKDINSSGQLQYELGYYLIAFVVERWGWEKVLQLMETNGDLKAILGISEKAFEKEFYTYMKNAD